MMVQGSVTKTRRMRNRIRHPRFRIGERVRFADGMFTGDRRSGDTATEDYSIIWVWTDGGAGWKMFLQGLGTIVESIEEPGIDGERGLP